MLYIVKFQYFFFFGASISFLILIAVPFLFSQNENYDFVGINSIGNQKYVELPLIRLVIIKKEEKNLLTDKRIPLYQNMYNKKNLRKCQIRKEEAEIETETETEIETGRGNKFIADLYFKSDKHKSLININKVYLFIFR